MMPLCDVVLGTDVVNTQRLEKSQARFGQRFFEKLLTPSELAWCGQRRGEAFFHRVGGRIAVKEAVAKALGVGLNGLGWQWGIHWHQVELLSASNQPPALMLYGKAQTLASEKQITTWRVSLAHDGPVALATVIGLIR